MYYPILKSSTTTVNTGLQIQSIPYLDLNILNEAARLGMTVEEYLKYIEKSNQTGVIYEDSGSDAINYYRSRTSPDPRGREAAAIERLRQDLAKLQQRQDAGKALNLITNLALPSTYAGLATGAMDISTGEGKDNTAGKIWLNTRLIQDLALPAVAGGIKMTPKIFKNLYYNQVVPRKDAIRDLAHYIKDARHRLNFIIDGNGDFTFSNLPITAENGGLRKMLLDISEHNAEKSYISYTGDKMNYVRYPMSNGTLTYFPERNSTSFTAKFPKYTDEIKYSAGEAAIRPDGVNGNNIIFTSPRVDVQQFIEDLLSSSNLEEIEMGKRLASALPSRINKNTMRNFWKLATATTRPGSYVSGDIRTYPLGNTAITTYKELGLIPALRLIAKGETEASTYRLGLSPDSYLALLKQGLRPEWNLSFSRKGGFNKWNNSAVDNAEIYNAWMKAQSGTQLDKLDYIKMFNEWVKPYGGLPAYIDDKGYIIHPHPFIMRRKFGGKLNYLNYIN